MDFVLIDEYENSSFPDNNKIIIEIDSDLFEDDPEIKSEPRTNTNEDEEDEMDPCFMDIEYLFDIPKPIHRTSMSLPVTPPPTPLNVTTESIPIHSLNKENSCHHHQHHTPPTPLSLIHHLHTRNYLPTTNYHRCGCIFCNDNQSDGDYG